MNAVQETVNLIPDLFEALSASDTEKMQLIHEQIFDAEQKADNIKNELRTDRLVLFPNKHVAETESLVTITTPRGKITGIGMQADLNSEQFKLLSNVKGVHHAL